MITLPQAQKQTVDLLQTIKSLTVAWSNTHIVAPHRLVYQHHNQQAVCQRVVCLSREVTQHYITLRYSYVQIVSRALVGVSSGAA